MRCLGMDNSHWRPVDWDVIWPFLAFCYFKATEGINFVDDQFEINKSGCEKYGVPNAPFHFFRDDADPIVQADFFLGVVGSGWYSQLIVDVELARYFDPELLKSFLDRVENRTGIKPSIYTSFYYWSFLGKPTWANNYDLLVAHYAADLENPLLPYGWASWRIWQFSKSFWFPGSLVAMDANWFNGDLQQCRDWFGNYRPYVPGSQVPVPVKVPTRMRVLVDGLRIRSGPGTSYPILGGLRSGDLVEVLDIGGGDSWVKHPAGWSANIYGGVNFMDPADE